MSASACIRSSRSLSAAAWLSIWSRLSAFKRRNIGSFNRQRLVVAAVLCCLIPATTRIPALAALGMVTAAACRLIAFEVIRYSETRERIRHGSRRS